MADIGCETKLTDTNEDKSMARLKIENFFQSSDVYLFGPTGVGKTTLVDKVQDITPVRYVSIGAITRLALSAGNEEVEYLMRQGGKWPLTAVQGLLQSHMDDPSPFILDGVPRHPDEAEWVNGEMKNREHSSIALVLSAMAEITTKRRLARDNSLRPETKRDIEERVAVYQRNQTNILKTLSSSLSDIIEIDTSTLNAEDVLQELTKRI